MCCDEVPLEILLGLSISHICITYYNNLEVWNPPLLKCYQTSILWTEVLEELLAVNVRYAQNQLFHIEIITI